jgi:hypothetical protein
MLCLSRACYYQVCMLLPGVHFTTKCACYDSSLQATTKCVHAYDSSLHTWQTAVGIGIVQNLLSLPILFVFGRFYMLVREPTNLLSRPRVCVYVCWCVRVRVYVIKKAVNPRTYCPVRFCACACGRDQEGLSGPTNRSTANLSVFVWGGVGGWFWLPLVWGLDVREGSLVRLCLGWCVWALACRQAARQAARTRHCRAACLPACLTHTHIHAPHTHTHTHGRRSRRRS